MEIEIKQMETDEEIKGKAYVHWRSWQREYAGIVSTAYLEKLTLDKCVEVAHRWHDNHLVAKDGGKVIGFICFGNRGEEAPETGEIFALYVLPEYWGTGVAQKLMEAGLLKLAAYPEIALWVLKDNPRAIRFYEKCGFSKTGEELYSKTVDATEIRMMLNR